jgi:hypothetical protein
MATLLVFATAGGISPAILAAGSIQPARAS